MTLWLPTNASGLYSWMKAKSSSDYTLSGGRITAVADKSGLGHGMLTTHRNGSSFSSTGLDGTNPAFTLVGSNSDGFETNISAGLSKVAYVAWLNMNGGTGYQAIFSGYDGTVGWVYPINNGSVQFGTNANFEFATANGVVAYNTPQLVILTRDTTLNTWEVRVNGTSIASGSYAETPSSPSTHLFGQGGGSSGSNDSRDFLTAAVGELNFLNAFTTADLESIEGYLLWDWGYQSLLPTGHTYKSAAPTTGGGGTAYTLTSALGTFAMTGVAAAQQQTRASDIGAFTMTGVAAAQQQTRASSLGTFAMTGIAAAQQQTRASSTGAFAMTGVAANLVYVPAGTVAYSLTAAPGAFAMAGIDAAQRISFTSGPGAFGLTGVAANLTFGAYVPISYSMPAATGAFALTGYAVAAPSFWVPVDAVSQTWAAGSTPSDVWTDVLSVTGSWG